MNKPHKSRNSEPNEQSPRNIFEIFSCSWAPENFSHSRGLRTDISPKTVVGCPWWRFSLNRRQRSLLLYVICVLSTRSFEWNLESIDIWTNCQFIWTGKVYIWLLVWEFQKLFLWQPCFNKPMHVENWETDHLQPDLYVDISNKFTLVWVFLMHVHK